jgi:hypothetical protein
VSSGFAVQGENPCRLGATLLLAGPNHGWGISNDTAIHSLLNGLLFRPASAAHGVLVAHPGVRFSQLCRQQVCESRQMAIGAPDRRKWVAAGPEMKTMGRNPVAGSGRQRVSVNWPLFIAPPQDCPIIPPDIMPDMVPEYVPVIVRPSADIVAWPSAAIEQDDIMAVKPFVGTLIWKVTVLPLTVPVILPLPIMPRPVSLKLIVPDKLLPF